MGTQKIDKDFILKNIISIIAGLSLLTVFLPYLAITAEVSGAGVSASDTEFASGFDVIGYGLWGILLILIPLLIIAANLINQFASYKKYVTLTAPALAIVNLIFFLPNSAPQGGGGNEYVSADVSTTLAIGGWIMVICMAILVALSLIQFFGIKTNIAILDETVNKSKNAEGINLNIPNMNLPNLSNVMPKNNTQSVPTATPVTEQTQQTAYTPKPVTAPVAQQQVSIPQQATVATVPIKGNPEEIMEQVKKLHEMKEGGILTDEEFTTKKAEFLAKI